MSDNKIVPALRFDFLTNYDDSLVALTTNESYLRNVMLSKIEMNESQSLLDVACGTGTFLNLVSSKYEESKFIGIDADQKILKKARMKNKNNIAFINTYSNSLPFDDNAFDFVCTSLFFHHIADKIKVETLLEIKRVLKHSGQFVFCDWDRPMSFLEHIGFFVVRLLDGFKITKANQNGDIDKILKSQFPNAIKTDSFSVPLGRISVWSATIE